MGWAVDSWSWVAVDSGVRNLTRIPARDRISAYDRPGNLPEIYAEKSAYFVSCFCESHGDRLSSARYYTTPSSSIISAQFLYVPGTSWQPLATKVQAMQPELFVLSPIASPSQPVTVTDTPSSQ